MQYLTKEKSDLVIQEQFTFLEQRLEVSADQIKKYAVFITIFSVVT
jgi:hypothetical protein